MEEEEKRKREEKKERKKRKRERKGKTKKRECVRVRGKRDGDKRKKKKKGERHFPSRSSANQRSKCVGARDKVGSRNESYAWVPKYEFFVEALRVRGFSYTGSSLFKSRK